MAGVPLANSIAGRVRQAVQELGVCTNKQVLAKVGETIPAARAIRSGRAEARQLLRLSKHKGAKPPTGGRPLKKHTTQELVQIGRRFRINVTLANLVKQGQIRRVKKGVYAPLLPKIYNPQNKVG